MREITELLLSKVAMEMAKSYHKNSFRGFACEEVLNKYPNIEIQLLRGMWEAIDAVHDCAVVEWNQNPEL